mgnify:FL=1
MYSGNAFSVNIHDLKIEGKNVKREIIDQFDSAGILAFDGNDVILIKQNHFPQGKLLEIPAGKIKNGEGPKQCASREFEEETGYQAKKIRHLLTLDPNVGYSTLTIHCFVASEVKKIKKLKPNNENEFIEVIRMNFKKLLKMIKTGKIIDAKTICAALVYESKFMNKNQIK